MRTLCAVILGGMALVGTAEARLGETKEQIIERYGVTKDDSIVENFDGQPLNCLVYLKSNDTCYFFVLLKDRVEVMQAYRIDGPPLKKAEAIELLNQNSSGKGFKKIESSEPDSVEEKYSEFDTGRIATWQAREGIITIKLSETRISPKPKSDQIEEVNKKTE